MRLNRLGVGLVLMGALAVAGCNNERPGHKPREDQEPNKSGPAREPNAVTPVEKPAVRFRLAVEGLPTSGRWKCDPKLADVNGDGRADLVAHPRKGRGPLVWFGDGAGRWRLAPQQPKFDGLSCGGNLHIVDVNNDGISDLVVADHCRGLYVYLGDGRGEFRAVTMALNAGNADAASGTDDEQTSLGFEDVGVGDVNGDGHADLVAGSSDPDGGFTVLLGDGSGAHWTPRRTSLPSHGWVNRIRLVDVNGDGHLDVVASWHEGPRVWHGTGAGDFQDASQGLPRPTSTLGLFHGLDLADFNEDGRLDLAVMNWINGIEVYLQQPDGSWRATPDPLVELTGGGSGLAVGDLNGDGHADIVACGRLKPTVGYIYGVFALLGDGRGGFRFVAGSGLPETGLAFNFGVTVGDVNGDGLEDVIVGSGGEVASVGEGPAAPVLPALLLGWLTEVGER
ncbi:MAG: VCBS repeat-containing protein [Phycisphaerae bacterium]|nr:VCBS repeat-containing protein [Phycisphaerae bacterium]MCZ2399430.1 VCBS repeat-containing protein [Phycisphaerae bacterium]NUQ49040.1 VCBS repeat-containing protein [Phycisphaerae bacterium]